MFGEPANLLCGSVFERRNSNLHRARPFTICFGIVEDHLRKRGVERCDSFGCRVFPRVAQTDEEGIHLGMAKGQAGAKAGDVAKGVGHLFGIGHAVFHAATGAVGEVFDFQMDGEEVEFVKGTCDQIGDDAGFGGEAGEQVACRAGKVGSFFLQAFMQGAFQAFVLFGFGWRIGGEFKLAVDQDGREEGIGFRRWHLPRRLPVLQVVEQGAGAGGVIVDFRDFGYAGIDASGGGISK